MLYIYIYTINEWMNLLLPNIGYNNRRDTHMLYLAYTKDTLNSKIIIIIIIIIILVVIV